MTFFSIERFVAVYYPIKLKHVLSKRKKFLLILLLLLVSFVFYLFIAETKEIEKSFKAQTAHFICTIKNSSTIELLNYIKIDTIISVLFPFAIITFMNILIVYRLKKSPLKKSDWTYTITSSPDSESKNSYKN